MSSSELAGPTWTAEEIRSCCTGTLHPLAVQGIQFFNRELFFEAHEDLELAWREETGPVRDLYRGILQVGLGYYHILRGEYRGALKMFLRCRNWLAVYPGTCRGVDVERLRLDYQRAETELLLLGPEHIAEFDRALIRPVVWIQKQPGKEDTP